MSAQRIVFAGTPEFARTALSALIGAGHEIVGVFTQPDRPAGRGRRMTPSPVRVAADAAGIPVFLPPGGAEMAALLANLTPVDVMVVAAYGLLLPPAALAVPRKGCLNIHASLLPRWRGAAPVARAIAAGDPTTGITIMHMDEGLDTGAIITTATVPIDPEDTTGTLTERLARTGAALLCATLPDWTEGHLQTHPQPAEGVSYAHKLSKAEAALDWREPALVLARKIRAFTPWPGTTMAVDDEILKVTAGHAAGGSGEPGRILAITDSVLVAAGRDALAVTRIQQPGKPPQPADVVARRLGWQTGRILAPTRCAKP